MTTSRQLEHPKRTGADSGDDSHFLAVVRRWATMLDADNYTVRHDNGNVVWEWQPPADIEAAMAASRSDLERRGQAYRLIDTYSLRPVPPYLAAPPPLPPAQTLTADAQAARSLAEQPPGPGPEPLDAATAVAAALLRAAVQQAGSIVKGRSRVGSRHRRGSAVSSPGCPGSVRGHHVSPRRGPVRGERGGVPAHARAHRTR